MGHQLVIETPDGKPTWMKTSVAQATGLKAGAEKIQLVNGKTLWVRDLFMDKSKHVRVVFDGVAEFTLGGVKYSWSEAFIYAPHIKGIQAYFDKIAATATPASAAGSKLFIHAAASFQQCNNKDWADDDSASSLRYGAVQCGLTSAAQLITAYWPPEKIKQLASEVDSGQFEDWVAGQFKRLGQQSISMEGHVATLKELGIPCRAYRDRSVSQLKEYLRDRAVILGFAYKSSGHFCTAVGYCDDPTEKVKISVPVGSIGNMVVSGTQVTQSGVIYNDPYGRRDWSGSANNWIAVSQTMTDAHGLHNVATDENMNTFWAEPDNKNSGWCVVPDKAVPGLKPASPVVLTATPTAPPLPPSSGAPSILITQGTYIKISTAAGATLSDSDKKFVSAGTTINCEVVGASAGHAKIKMPDGKLWFVFNAHFKGQEQKGIVTDTATALPMVSRAKIEQAIAAVVNPNIPSDERKLIVDSIMTECPKFGVNTPARLAHFIAQTAHESGGYMYTAEIGDVDYFTENYEGRDDLGNTQPGDGAKFPGFGWIQVTGRNNVTLLSKKINRPDLLNDPTPIGEYPLCVTASLSWWEDNKMNPDCDRGVSESNIETITRIINGGTNGLGERIHHTLLIAPKLGC